MKLPLFTATMMFTLSSTGLTQSTETAEELKQYVPVLPSVRKQFFEIDPKLGYALKEVGGGVYVMSDNGWQSAQISRPSSPAPPKSLAPTTSFSFLRSS